MKKAVKIILSILCSLFIFMITVPILLGLVLQIGVVQNFAVRQVTDWLSGKSDLEVDIGRVDIGFFNRAKFQRFYIQDLQGDTLLYAQELSVGIDRINFFSGSIGLGTVTLSQATVNLAKDSTGAMNLNPLLQVFKSKEPKSAVSAPFRLTTRNIKFENVHFRYHLFRPSPRENGINFQDLDFNALNLHVEGLSIVDDDIRFRIKQLSFREKSGLELLSLTTGKSSMDSTGIRLEQLHLQTPQSDLKMGHLRMLYDRWSALNHFVQEVRFDADIQPSRLSYRTLGYFMTRPPTLDMTIGFEGQVQGPIAQLKGQLSQLQMSDTRMKLDFAVTGLPSIENSWFICKLEELQTDGDDIQAIYTDLSGGKKLSGDLPALLTRAGKIGFSGTFDGLLSDFTATGNLSTSQGSVQGSLKFMPAVRRGETRLLGHIQTRTFQLGRLLAIPDLGSVTAYANVDAVTGGPRGLALETDATIDQLSLKGYPYTGIRMDGQFAGRTFDGQITCNDPNLDFTTTGHFDLTERVPAYDFEMHLRRVDLHALHLNTRDTISVASAHFRAHATGTTLDDINGNITIDSLSYINPIDTLRASAIHFEARNSIDSKLVTMRSRFADIDLFGKNSYSNIFRFLSQSLRRYLPSIPEAETILVRGSKPSAPLLAEQPFDDGYYYLKVNVKQADNLAGIFVPGLEVAENSSLNFWFNPAIDQFNLSVASDYILHPGFYAGKVMVECRNQADSVSLFASVEQFGVGAIDLPNLSLIGGVKNNRIALSTRFSNPTNQSSALISTLVTPRRSATGSPQWDILFYPATFTISSQTWYIASSHVIVEGSSIDFQRFRLWGGGQQVVVDGRASASETDTLRVNISRFGLRPLSKFVNLNGYELGGRLDGQAQLVAPLGNLQFSARLSIDTLSVNQHRLGHVDLVSDWDRSLKRMDFYCRTPDGDKPVSGYYASAEKQYHADIHFPRMGMELLEPLLTGILSDTRGEADVQLTLDGKGAVGPLLNGTVNVKSYAATVDYTRARYTLAGVITVKENRFDLPRTPIRDAAGGTGTIRAWFDSNYFKQMRFDVQASFRDLLCLNTTLKDNSLFYGQAYGTGTFHVAGDEQKITLDVKAETAKSSSFVMPLSDVSTIAEADFITFRESRGEGSSYRDRPQDRMTTYLRERNRGSNQTSGGGRRRRQTGTAMELNLNIGVLPNTEAQIVMDPRLGDAIKGRGNGRFDIHIAPARDVFTMDGRFNITSGSYLFTLYGVVAKYFDILSGGYLVWTGDPADPLVDINAVYKVRTSLKPLIGQNSGGIGGGNVNINCGIRLSDRLFDPTIQLSVTAPGADTETQNLLRNLLNTPDAIQIQFAYLLLSNSFIPDNQANSLGTMGGSLAGVAGMEFLSNQISNLISGSNYNIRVGYRPQSDVASQEVTFDVGADIIANKLSFEVGGSYDVGQPGIYTNSNIPLTIDGSIAYAVNKSGTLKIKGFTRTIDRFDESQGLQDSGVGIYWSQSFQSMRDLKERYRQWIETMNQNRIERQDDRRERHQENAEEEVVQEQATPPQ